MENIVRTNSGKEKIEEFGKDNGLIHEAVITGRGVGAGREFWSKLAHDKELFKRVVWFVEKDTLLAIINNKIVIPAMGSMTLNIDYHFNNDNRIIDFRKIDIILSDFPETFECCSRSHTMSSFVLTRQAALGQMFEGTVTKGVFESDLYDVICLLKKQGTGQSGFLATDGNANFFFIRDKKGTLCVVYVYWDCIGWCVCAESMTNIDKKITGGLIFSRNFVGV